MEREHALPSFRLIQAIFVIGVLLMATFVSLPAHAAHIRPDVDFNDPVCDTETDQASKGEVVLPAAPSGGHGNKWFINGSDVGGSAGVHQYDPGTSVTVELKQGTDVLQTYTHTFSDPECGGSNGDRDNEPEHKVWVCLPDEYFDEEVKAKGHGDNPVWINWNAQGGWQSDIRELLEEDAEGFYIVDGPDSPCPPELEDEDDENGGGSSSSSSSSSSSTQVAGQQITAEVMGEQLAFTGVSAARLGFLLALATAAIGGGYMLTRRSPIFADGDGNDLADTEE